MTRDERLLKRALDVLDGAHDVFGLEKDGIAIKTALRERLAQPEQEPVATVRVHKTGGNAGIAWSAVPTTEAPMMVDGDKLYTLEGIKK